VADTSDDHVICATYTHARRHPLVLGHIAGWTPPFQLSLAQLGILVVTIWVETQTWGLWGAHLPRAVGAFIAIVTPMALAWVVRRARIEGRSLPRAAVGYLLLLATPRHGRVGGRPSRTTPASAPGRALTFVAAGIDER